MNATEVIDLFEDRLLEAKDMGLDSISLASLDELLGEARQTAEHTPPELARYEAALENHRFWLANKNARWNSRREITRDMTNHTINTGANALKTSTLINGGASIALLAFAGQIQSVAASSELMTSISIALAFFATGVLLSAVAIGATYLSQAAFGREFDTWSKKAGPRWRNVAIAGVFLSFAMFVGGGGVCALAFGAMAEPGPVRSEAISVP